MKEIKSLFLANEKQTPRRQVFKWFHLNLYKFSFYYKRNVKIKCLKIRFHKTLLKRNLCSVLTFSFFNNMYMKNFFFLEFIADTGTLHPSTRRNIEAPEFTLFNHADTSYIPYNTLICVTYLQTKIV